MSRLLLGIGLLLSLSSHGQNLLAGKRYMVSKVTSMRFDGNKQVYYDFGARPANYFVSPIASGIQIRTLNYYSATPGLSVANTACRITNVKYLRHEFESGTLTEEYTGVYSTVTAGELLSLPGLPNPSAVEVDWEAKENGTGLLHLHWFFGPKRTTGKLLGQSYYECTLYCEPSDL